MTVFEVFDAISVPGELRQVFQDTEVTKIVASRKGDRVKVVLKSEKLLFFKQLQSLLAALNEQYFAPLHKEAFFEEHYELSQQYTAQSLWDLYYKSLYDEYAAKSRLFHNYLVNAEISMFGNELHVRTEDTFMNRHAGEQVNDSLERLFLSRFSMTIRVITEYVKTEEPEPTTEPEITYEFMKKRDLPKSKKALEKEKEKAEQKASSSSEGAEPQVEKQEAPQTSKVASGKQDAKKAPEKTFTPKKKLPDDPDIFFGKPYDGDVMRICDIEDSIGECVVRGKIIKLEERELRNEKILFLIQVTDFTDSIGTKIFAKREDADNIRPHVKEGKFVLLKGQALYDSYDKEVSIGSLYGIKNINDYTVKRMDTADVKRVELHAHTTMSDMDAMVDATTLVKTAFEWGMPGIAITDHGVVQAFPDAYHAINPKDYADDPEKQQRAKDFKVIYGVEAYLVDDVVEPVKHSEGQSLRSDFVVFDIETTGFLAKQDKIIEIGAVRVRDGKLTERFSTFVNPLVPIPPRIEDLTGIKDSMVMEAPTIDIVLPDFLRFCEGASLVAHNAGFDTGFIQYQAERISLPYHFTVVDTVGLARALLPNLNRYKLDTVAKELSISLENHHRAVDDAGCTAEIFVRFLDMLEKKGAKSLDEVNEICKPTPEMIKKLPTYHAIILIQNEVGRINLYRLISLSHIEYFAKRPRIPKSLFLQYREGLIIGSACEAGELYQAILREAPRDEIVRLCEFYDYYEIQPLGNNRFMLHDEKIENVKTEDDLIEINRQIVALSEEFKKPVAATCDVHFLNPEDEVYRRIIMSSRGFSDADNQAPLYLRTTEEMLWEFSYLGAKKAEEVVITNPLRIFDQIEKISPVFPDKCAPVIADSDVTLRRICYEKANSMYGDPLPEIVSERLEHELQSIIKNGFAVMYIIAQKLVWKSNEDGYLVGSRGSVGSSFVATMAGITEVNPLPAHYYCSSCHFSDFDSPDLLDYQRNGISGCDMPDRLCPSCGAKLVKDGHDIPFETFLGFNGDKEPDIDLNFSGEYQSKAHDYTEVIFGKGQTFRAGTVGTVAEKTAYGYVLKYNEEHDIKMRKAEVERLSRGCVGVRRSTGQHPGGIIVLPIGHEIYKFTPVQRPANDMNTNTVTTHFDYHSIDHNLLKLDILGHDDPTMIRRLEDLTGLDAQTIPMDDEKVISLFASTEALGIAPEDIGGCDLGSLGLPELGTDFVMQMLRDTRPKSFSEMVRISGLSHGTDVWLNNTQTLIKEGQCTLSNAICTRDDIMSYLIHQGVENGHAFKIMESVRKGKGLTPEMEEEMLANGVPDWYIWSCKKIKYMFPKAHACAYVMMAFRIGYYKVYYPLAYYAAYFGIRATSFNYEIMCLGRPNLEKNMRELKRKVEEKSATAKEIDTYSDAKIVQEMYARGFDFMPIDIFKAKAHDFQIIDGKLMASLQTIEGVGEKAADQIAEAVKDGPFLSKDDFRIRCKVSQTTTDQIAELSLLPDLPESNQISLGDFFSL